MDTYTPARPWAALLLLVCACATRTVPDAFPRGSAASARADEGQALAVSSALDEDPPLPGEESERWPGLDGGASGSHEGHDHGMKLVPKP